MKLTSNLRAWLLIPASVTLVILHAISGCARFSTKQTDISTTNPYGEPCRTITTKATSYTLFSANSKLATWKATQTDKTQGASVGGLEQSSSGTNVINVIDALTGLAKALKGQ